MKTNSSQLAPQVDNEIIYPDSDGQPMADNTKQFDWISNIVYNLRSQFEANPNVFIAGDLLWYPVEGNNKIRRAPDAMVAFGRQPGHRGSYRQWMENDIAPQVVFEIRSPGNSDTEMEQKFQFYQTYQVEEYYLYDPDEGQLKGWIRAGGQLCPVVPMHGWKSKHLGIRFELIDTELYLYHPNGNPFTSHQYEARRANDEQQRADDEQQRADSEQQRADEEQQRANDQQQRADDQQQRADGELQRANKEQQRANDEQQRANDEQQRADLAEQQLAHFQELLKAQGISLDE